MKARFIFIVLGALISADFAFADMVSQPVAGGGGTNASSAGYSMKAAAADPGVGRSQSANYIYDHGTLWATGTSTATSTPQPEPGFGGNGDGGSGSGWDEWWDINNPDLGISPITPVKSPVTESVIKIVKAVVSLLEVGAVPMERFSVMVKPWITEKCPGGCVIVGVNPQNGVQEVAVMLVKRVMPWPLWLAIALVILGVLGTIASVVGTLSGRRWLVSAGVLVALALGLGIWLRFHYRAAFRAENATAIVDERTVSAGEIDGVVRGLAEELPLGGHKLTVLGSPEAPQMTITIYVKKTLPI